MLDVQVLWWVFWVSPRQSFAKWTRILTHMFQRQSGSTGKNRLERWLQIHQWHEPWTLGCLILVDLSSRMVTGWWNMMKIHPKSISSSKTQWRVSLYLGDGFKYFFFSPRSLEKILPFWRLHMFQMGWFNVGSTTNVEKLVGVETLTLVVKLAGCGEKPSFPSLGEKTFFENETYNNWLGKL